MRSGCRVDHAQVRADRASLTGKGEATDIHVGHKNANAAVGAKKSESFGPVTDGQNVIAKPAERRS
jgi:hypothetical protein